MNTNEFKNGKALTFIFCYSWLTAMSNAGKEIFLKIDFSEFDNIKNNFRRKLTKNCNFQTSQKKFYTLSIYFVPYSN